MSDKGWGRFLWVCGQGGWSGEGKAGVGTKICEAPKADEVADGPRGNQGGESDGRGEVVGGACGSRAELALASGGVGWQEGRVQARGYRKNGAVRAGSCAAAPGTTTATTWMPRTATTTIRRMRTTTTGSVLLGPRRFFLEREKIVRFMRTARPAEAG